MSELCQCQNCGRWLARPEDLYCPECEDYIAMRREEDEEEAPDGLVH